MRWIDGNRFRRLAPSVRALTVTMGILSAVGIAMAVIILVLWIGKELFGHELFGFIGLIVTMIFTGLYAEFRNDNVR
ncbi:exported hypothetical protein [Rhodococcus ruber]|uniref:Uncharacterized protein n=1 Tax=Rhodococcus ruber TaxID=1830 RepID=A0A098BJS6_9NOCA|nr:exported hypothetical protein [Rhodococcus ruber]